MPTPTKALPSRAVRLFLRVTLPFLTVTALVVLIQYLDQFQANPSHAAINILPMAEYPLAGVAIAAAGAYLIEYIIHRNA